MLAVAVSMLLSNPGFMLHLCVWFVWTFVQQSLLRMRSIVLPAVPQLPVKICKVLYRIKFIDVDLSSPQNFLTCYWGSASLDYLKRANVSLYCIKGETVYFVETDPGCQH